MAIDRETVSTDLAENKTGGPPQKKKALRRFSYTTLVLLAIALFFFFNFHTVVVSGQSMEPTFHTGERLLACKAYWLVGPIRDKDVVVIQRPGEYIIKRVYKTAGETVDFVNAPANWDISQGEYKVPAGCVYVLGDNRPVSSDSRVFGAVQASNVIGKILRL
ncbi:MAG TPA: signal peptidase I [Fimbriimonadaceae bacterium]|jgi:signal peptidase I